MARPNSNADLNVNQETAKVATFQMENLARAGNVDLMIAYQRFMETALASGGLVEEDYGGLNVKVPRSDADKDKELSNAQKQWDSKLKGYMEALKNPHSDKDAFEYSFRRDEINRFAKEEGYEEIDWTVRDGVQE